MSVHPLARRRELKCHDCGMPLDFIGQFHPWEACRLFERTHDSSVVAVEMRRLQCEVRNTGMEPRE